MLSSLPILGTGIGFRQPFLSKLFLHQEKVDFLEIIAEHYLNISVEKEKELELLTAHFPLVPHAINLSIGSAEGLDTAYVSQLAKLITRLNPPWWSEHLCFTKAGGIDIGHLSPLPYTWEAVEVVCRNIERLRSYLEVPLIIENIAYLVNIPDAEMTEAQFIAEIVQRSNCGLLLDVTNLYTNAVNHNYDIEDFLAQFPLERVVQLHFVGGYWQDGILIDSHSHATPEPVWELMAEVLARTNTKGVILERDENLPSLTELTAELDRARSLGRKYGRWD